MRRILTLLWIGVCFPAFAQAGEAEPLTYAGIPVEFVYWKQESPTFLYSDLDVIPQRLLELRDDDTSFINRLYRFHVHVFADGSIEQRVSYARLYLTQSGIAERGNFHLWVDASTERMTIEQAYVLLPNGKRVEVDWKTIQLVADSTDDIFSDSFAVIVPFSGLEPYGIAVLVAKTRQDADAWPLPWARIFHPQSGAPVEEFDLLLTWEDRDNPPQWQSDYDNLKCQNAGERAVRCRTLLSPAYPRDQHVKYLDAMPSLVVAERTSWAALAQQVNTLFESALDGDQVLQETLDRLLEGTSNEEERLDRIHQFVSQKIRYVGLEYGIGGIVPRPTGQTLRRRFGDCKDKTALFIDLARRAGFKAHPVLTTWKRSNPGKLLIPAANYFDHMVACVAMSSGEERCLDLTDPNSPFESLSAFVQGAIRLDLIDVPSAPSVLPADRYYQKRTVQTVNRLMSDGALEERQTRTYEGQHGAWLRATLQPMSRSDRHDWATKMYQGYVASNANPTFEFDGIGDVRAPVVIRSTARYPGGEAYLEHYWEYESDIRAMPEAYKSTNSVHDYVFAGSSYRGETLIHLPPGRRARSTGPELNFSTPFGELRRRYEISDDVVRVVTDMSLPRATIPLSDIPSFNRFMDQIRDQAKIWFTMSPVGPTPRD